MLSHIGLMRDPRASKDMVPDGVWKMMPPDPETEKLDAERARLKGGQYWIKGSENEDRIRELTRAYREDYFNNRPTWDIEANEQEEREYIEPAIDLYIPERAQLAEILCNQPNNLSSTELLELRILEAELMVVLCGKRETVKRNRIQRRARADVKVKEESPGPNLFPLLMDRKQCPNCIGDETLSFEERTFKYCRPAVMYDHFDRKHTQQLGNVKQMSCNHPKCREEALEFKYLNYFKNHVEQVHGVKLRA
ncbi:FluG domain-containing protein [Podospora fimiseda]|uniref:FluG domain-containing protein n=1 Tax=Podospora fimiseda TaxID=252190 RepID=A0AAN7BEM5_9PEZI|nr:FluG domain-containing protein [Podospora fimiseda]